MLKVYLIFLSVTCFLACSFRNTDYLVTLSTEYGDIKLILYDQTPKHKENFIKLAKEGQFDSTTFHRIIRNFMIQGGDVNAKKNSEGSIDYTIPAEFVDTLIHHRGALGAARQGDQINPEKESNGSQFYIVQGNVFSEWQLTLDLAKVNAYLPKLAEVPGYDTVLTYLENFHKQGKFQQYNEAVIKLVPVMEERFDVSFRKPFNPKRLQVYTTMGGAPHLDDAYTVFGRVVEGMEVVDKIASVQTGHADKPVEDIYITVSLQEISKDEWHEKYGGLPW